MATAELNTTNKRTATGQMDYERRSGEVAAEWMLVASAMVGAVCGALAGVSLSALTFPAAEPTVLGSLGSILGSLSAAVACGLFSRRR